MRYVRPGSEEQGLQTVHYEISRGEWEMLRLRA
jgi:hypothetical protein